MIEDRTGLLSDNQAITASAASTNLIDLGATGTPFGASAALVRDIGNADVPLVVTVTESFNNLTSLSIQIQTDTTAAFSAPTVAYQSPTYTLAQLATAAKYLLPDEFPVGTGQRYVRLFYTLVGTAPTTGKITAGVVSARQRNRRY